MNAKMFWKPSKPYHIGIHLKALVEYSQMQHVTKLPATWGWAVVFAGYSGFLHYLQLASHELATIGLNVTIKKIPNFKLSDA